MIAIIAIRGHKISMVFQRNYSCKPSPAAIFSGMMSFAHYKATVSHDTWERRGQRLWEADRKSPKKAKKMQQKTKCNSPHLPSGPPSCHPFSSRNQPDLLVAGDFLDHSEVMDWCATVECITLPSACVELWHCRKKRVRFYFKERCHFVLESWECKNAELNVQVLLR